MTMLQFVDCNILNISLEAVSIFWDYLHLLHYRHIIKSLGNLIQVQLVLQREFVRVFPHLDDHDLGMYGELGVLLGGKELFVEFLAISPSGEFRTAIDFHQQAIHQPLAGNLRFHTILHKIDAYYGCSMPKIQ